MDKATLDKFHVITDNEVDFLHNLFENAHTPLRFGQFLCNSYLRKGEHCPELFYETDTAKALNFAKRLTKQKELK